MEIMKKLFKKIDKNMIAILLIVLAISTRLLPHIANFTAVGAIALFSGVYLKRKYAVILPLGIMMFSDIIIGIHSLIFFTWGAFVLMGFIGLWVRKEKNVANVIVGTLAGSLLFFFITNTAVWAFTPLYEKNFNGLLLSYTMAIPFFRNSLAGNFFYVVVLFGAYEGARYMITKLNSSLETSSYIK